MSSGSKRADSAVEPEVAEHYRQVASFTLVGWLWLWFGRWRCGRNNGRLANFCDRAQHLATMP
jgi:hypothetical protein